ncbi:MAG: hypothetical protein LIO79_10310 [Rikenellaceae bacterium]|nr:hypothetical protein [Rikenellaceae bacterium]
MIEKNRGHILILKDKSGIEDLVSLLRESCGGDEGEEQIKERFNLSALQAKYIMNTTLRDLASAYEDTLNEQII